MMLQQTNHNISAEMADEILRLNNQLCFAFYVCSKEVIKKYKPLLDPLGLTYTSYITMLALWEKDDVPVKELGEKLYLDSGTLTPILKKLEEKGYISRIRKKENERNVYILLTPTGKNLKQQAIQIPLQLANSIGCGAEEASDLIPKLHEIIHLLTKE
jgi:DNA-binding MarR family transcriptional regulator